MKIDPVHKCPYCGYVYQVVFGENTFSNLFSDPRGRVAVHSIIQVCPHIVCGKTEVSVEAGLPPAAQKGRSEAERAKARYDLPNSFFSSRLLPSEVSGKREFNVSDVPETVFRDYDEACRLLRTSPCASATYARRCLQAMVRKKFKLKPGKFQNEIKALSSMNGVIRQEVVDALEYVRKMGRFRAMPDDDVKVLVDVSYDEAQQTIDVIEALMFDWFIAPAERDKRVGALKAIIESKKQ
ncbi:MAG: DUF4145 domain-containing protein [Synergistaceae bacterium]|jgi:hypothetical protein|nr:DUF4145 domain-containing protein [Synergistaceae bacterium]